MNDNNLTTMTVGDLEELIELLAAEFALNGFDTSYSELPPGLKFWMRHRAAEVLSTRLPIAETELQPIHAA